MTRTEYLDELSGRLSELTARERDSILAFYRERFDRAGPGGEQSLMDELGSPASLASRILAERAIRTAREKQANPARSLSAFWAAVCAVCIAIFAAPFALPVVVLAFVGIVVGGALALAGAVAAIAVAVGGIGLFAGGMFGLLAHPASAVILFGVAFLLWGLVKIACTVIGALLSLLGDFILWLFGSSGGKKYGQ